MAFDPDAFLAGTAPAAPAFDPDAFLKGAAPAAAAASEASAREKELRAQYLKDLGAPKAHLQANETPGTVSSYLHNFTDYSTRLKDSATMGLMRPLGGVMRGVSGVFDPTSTFGERYRAGVGAEEDYAKEAEKNTPGALGTAVDVAGGLATGGGLKSAVAPAAKTVAVEAPTKVEQLAKIIGSNTGQGAIEGAARNAESLPNAVVGAGVGGAVGGVTGKAVGLAGKAASPVVGALTDRFNMQAAKKAVTDATERGGGSEVVKEAGSAVYKKLDDAGIKFKDATPLVKDTIDKMQKEGFNYASGVHGDLVPVAERIGKLNGKSTTWGELQQIRTQLSNAKASDNKDVRRMAGHLADTLDEFVDTAKPTIAIGKLGTVSPGDPGRARDLWRRGSQAENAEWLTKKGMATTKDPGRKLETNFGGELDKINNPKRFSTHQGNPEQAAQIEKIAVGDPNRAKLAQFLKQQSGKLVGLGALGTAGGVGGIYGGDTTGIGSGVGYGGAATLGLGLLGKAGAGKLSRGIAKRGGERANELIRGIVTGGKKGPVNVPREALAKLMAAEQAKRGASRYAASKFDKE